TPVAAQRNSGVFQRPAEPGERLVGREPARAEAAAHEQEWNRRALDELGSGPVELRRRKRRDDQRAWLFEDPGRARRDEDGLGVRAGEPLEGERRAGQEPARVAPAF